MDELAPTRPIPTDAVEDTSIIDESLPFTMTGPVRLQAVIDAVRYCVRSKIYGGIRGVRSLARRLGAGDATHAHR